MKTQSIMNNIAEGIKPHTQENFDRFYEMLKVEYTKLFKEDPRFARAASMTTPSELARKITIGLDSGNADKSGQGVINTCKALGIRHTYKDIRAFLNEK